MLKLLFIFLVIFFVSIPSTAQIVNGTFESGRNAGWIEASQGNYTLIGTGEFFASSEIQPSVNPRSGSWMARIGGYSYEINAISQTITLPNTTPLYLAFYAQSRSANTSECAGLWVGAKVSIIINNQEIYYTYLCQYNDLSEWTLLYVDMSALAGQSAQIVFKAESANSVWSYLYIDDVSITSTTSVDDNNSNFTSFKLFQNYPNPFNPMTKIGFRITDLRFVSLKIYDILGREIAILVNEEKKPGDYEVEFHSLVGNEYLASGIYYYQLRAGDFIETKKMILTK